MQTALATVDAEIVRVDPAEYFKPSISVADAVERQKQLAGLVSTMLVPAKVDKWGNVNMDGADYGLIPGTKNRTLFQPGAEKLALFFGLTVTTYCTEKEEVWGPEAKDAFFRYTYKATASFKGQVIRETERTCHTREKKYAWIWVERAAPDKAEQAEMIENQCGRWGSKWENRQKISIWQERKPNPDPWSLQFVVQAMAQKRAKVAVVKEALAATGYFSTEIDFEDFAGQDEPEPAGNGASKGDSGKLKQTERAAKTSGGRQILGLKGTLKMDDAEFLALIKAECDLDAQDIFEAADEITEAEQKLIIENLKDRLQK